MSHTYRIMVIVEIFATYGFTIDYTANDTIIL